MKPTLPPYVYGRECSENERVLPIETVQRLIDQAYAAGLEDAALLCDARLNFGDAGAAMCARAIRSLKEGA